MKRMICPLSFLLLFCFLASIFSFPVSAAEAAGRAQGLVLDEAGLFPEHVPQLQQQAAQAASATGINVLILTTESTGGKEVRRYGADFYESLGFTDQDPGVLFLIDMGEREIAVITSQASKKYFPVSKTDQMVDRCYDYAADDDFAGAAGQFLADAQDAVLNYGVKPVGKIASIAVAIGLCVGGITVGCLFFSHPRLGKQGGRTRDYLEPGNGMRLREKRDDFISTHTSRTLIPKDNNSNHSSGGSFSSSSGGSYSGSSRKF